MSILEIPNNGLASEGGVDGHRTFIFNSVGVREAVKDHLILVKDLDKSIIHSMLCDHLMCDDSPALPHAMDSRNGLVFCGGLQLRLHQNDDLGALEVDAGSPSSIWRAKAACACWEANVSMISRRFAAELSPEAAMMVPSKSVLAPSSLMACLRMEFALFTELGK